ncbi:hypothetical protein [Fangia hongkongensis]|uniref:hypothetical protein n=1 Tax=Fangia hongkongensis TaxID=270495 RepID=UPI00036C000F|nr:hypothetical protein [Fangia hongkongensis]
MARMINSYKIVKNKYNMELPTFLVKCIRQGMTKKQIAVLIGCNDRNISYLCKKYQITIRSKDFLKKNKIESIKSQIMRCKKINSLTALYRVWR